MNKCILYCPVLSPALSCCITQLHNFCNFQTTPSAEVTHLLLPVPSLDADGNIKGGPALSEILQKLSKEVTVIGGNLTHPVLAGYQTMDLLKDPEYLAANARITAHCALTIAAQHLECTWDDCKVLITGWGRIAKCLALLLKPLGARITVCARNPADLAMAHAFGLHAVTFAQATPAAYEVLFNTVPHLVFSNCPETTLNVDLASNPGLAGGKILTARGLPGKYAPVSSGKLIAQTIQNILCKE